MQPLNALIFRQSPEYRAFFVFYVFLIERLVRYILDTFVFYNNIRRVFNEYRQIIRRSRKMKRNKTRMAAMLIGLAVAFTACGKKEPAGIVEDLGQLEGEKTDGTKGEGLNAMLAVNEETWTDSVTLGGKTINICAKVMLPECGGMQSVSLEPQRMEGENKKALLEKLVEQPFVLDPMDPPQWYIDDNIDDYKMAKKIYNTGATDPEEDDYYKYVLRVLDAWETRDAGAFKDKTSQDYEEITFYGDYRGHTYEILFSEGFIGWNPVDYAGMTHYEASSGKIFPGQVGIGDKTSKEAQLKWLETGDNHCELSLEEAEAMAEDFIQSLGYTNFSCGQINALSWNDSSDNIDFDKVENCYIDGYDFTFYRDIDGVVMGTDKTVFGCLKHGAYDKDYGMIESICVAVTDAGVIAMNAGYLHEEKEILSERTSLLSYEQVKDRFLFLLSDDPSYFEYIDSIESLNVLELTYYMLEEEDASVIIPVWRLEQQKSSYDIDIQADIIDEVTYVLMINAIDGSVIDPGPVKMSE